MKKIRKKLSLLIIFIIVFNIMVPTMTKNNMYSANVGETLGSTVVDTEKKDGEQELLNADLKKDFFIPYHTGYTLLKSGKIKEFSDKNRIISEKIKVDSSIYYFKNLSAKYGNCFYVIYDSNDQVITWKRTNESSTGEVIENIRVIMPKNAAYFRLACDLNVNNEMFEAAKPNTEPKGKISQPAVISFIDDDCKSQVYTDLYPLIKELELPYTLACPPDSLDDEKGLYMTKEQLQEMYANGVDVISHHLNEDKMTEFESIDAYEQDTKDCLDKFGEMGIEVNGVAYPNGVIKEDYIPVVKSYFKLGFTTDRGINTLPYESCYIDRCELFPTSGIYNINDAKALVDSVAENGGWLVFMTHCWYDTFSAKDLEELVGYIRGKNIEISNVTNIIENYANPIDIGIVKKPLEDMSEDFYILDCMGRAYTNNIEKNYIETNDITITEKSSIKWEEQLIDYNIAVALKPNGKEVGYYEEQEILTQKQIEQRKRNVSTKIYVTPNVTYKLTNMSAKYGKCFYVIYDSNNKVISYQATTDSSTGETLDEIIIKMPENASFLKVACDLNINNKMFKVYRANLKGNMKQVWEEIHKDFLTEEMDISYRKGFTLLKSGKIKTFTEENRIISEEIFLNDNKVYCFENISAKYGNCFGVIYDSNDKVISYLATTEASNGEVIEKVIITMPENASYFRLACDLNVNNEFFKAYSLKKY